MEELKIKAGAPMDYPTFVKYLQQSDFPVRINLRGRLVIDNDLQLVITNTGQRGCLTNLFFGNYFRDHPEITSMAIQPGNPFKQRTLLAFFDPKSDHIRNHAIEMAVSIVKDKPVVQTSKTDRKRLVDELIELSKDTSMPIELPKAVGHSILVKISFHPIPGKEYLAVRIDSIAKRKVGDEVDGREKASEHYLTNVVAKKTKLDTDIIKRIDQETPKRGLIREFITPVMAEDLMTRNIKNRPLNYLTVFGYDTDMVGGKWKWTNESTVGFDIDGHLKDGQHRLLAIIKSGTTQETVIFTGIAVDAHAVLNTGRSRTTGDTMALMGSTDPNQMASNVTFIRNMYMYGGPVTWKKQGRKVNNADMVEFNSNEENAARMKTASVLTDKVYYKYGKKLMTKTLWTGMHYLLSQKSKAAAEEFLTRLATGEKIGADDETSPIFKLRNILFNWGKNPKVQPPGKKGIVQRVRYIIVAWNHYRAGEIIDRLMVDADGELPKISK